MLAFLLPLAAASLVRGRAGVGTASGSGDPGTKNCMPVVCRAICECRQGLPEPPYRPPIAILPPPLPEWDQTQTQQFCGCTALRLADCATDLCREKIRLVQELMHCDGAVENAALAAGVGTTTDSTTAR